jgi:signal transduction histidine kinase
MEGASPRPNVWIVDDSPLDIERARRVLDEQYTVLAFQDGSAMLEHLAAHPAPDVLILDWVMPGVSGIEVCRFLRGSSPPLPQLAILLLTMQSQTDQIVEGLAAGANDYLVKPFADPELRARVEALVRWNGLLDRAQKAEASVIELLEHAPDAFISVGPELTITYVNGEAQRALNRTAIALIGKPLAQFLPQLPLDTLGSVVRHPRPLADIEIGDQIYSPTVRSLPGDTRSQLTIALRNVTARRQKESRRLDFYSIIAHDLRSPLGAMLMRTDLMLRGRRGVLSAELIGDLRKMEGHMRGLVALINDFLEFAKMEESQSMERVRIDMKGLIEETVEDFKPLIDNARQEFRIEDQGSAIVMGDRRRLKQVLNNLIANAIKFTPAEGRITVGARAAENHACEVFVADNGPGIPAEVLPRLFQRYTRGPNLKIDVGGTGLGLLIVREIVEAHGGNVGVESTPGQGSRFWFRVPAEDASAVKDGPRANAS